MDPGLLVPSPYGKSKTDKNKTEETSFRVHSVSRDLNLSILDPKDGDRSTMKIVLHGEAVLPVLL